MSALRASPSIIPSIIPSITPSPTPLNETVTMISSALRISPEKLTMVMGDPNPSSLNSIESSNVYIILVLAGILAAISAIGYLIFAAVYKNEMQKPIDWISTKYNNLTGKDVLPVIRPKKAKESPFVGPIDTPPILPYCPRLDGSEKGQNIMFRFRGNQRARIESSEVLNDDNETRITIIAVLGNNGKPPLPPSHI